MQVANLANGGNVAWDQVNRRNTWPCNLTSFEKRGSKFRKGFLMPDGWSSWGGQYDTLNIGSNVATCRNRAGGVNWDNGKYQLVQARLSDDELGDAVSGRTYHMSDTHRDDASSMRYKTKYSGTVLPYVSFACLGAILSGYHLGVVNGALEYLSRDLGIANNAVLQGWVVSMLLAGATVGAFTGGTLADRFGRIRAFQLDAIPLAIGAFLCATAQTVETMIFGRFISGVGIGIASSVVPLYISEISPTETRGKLGSINQLSVCVGILMALVFGLPLAGNPLWWRTMFVLAAVPPILMAFGMFVAPESPRWLFQQGKISEAESSTKTLFGSEKVPEVMYDLRASSYGPTPIEPDISWSDLFSKHHREALSLGAALFLFQQFGGINAVIYYSTAVFRSAGIASDIAASALVSAANLLGTAVASMLVDKQGRKSLLLTSFAGMALSMLLLALSFSWNASAPYSGVLAVLGTIFYTLSFSLGAGPVPSLLLPEIFPSKIRAKAVALSMGVHWLTNFIIGLTFLTVVNKFGISRVYLAFAAVCLAALMYITRNVFETKGRSLEEIERSLKLSVI